MMSMVSWVRSFDAIQKSGSVKVDIVVEEVPAEREPDDNNEDDEGEIPTIGPPLVIVAVCVATLVTYRKRSKS